MGVGGPLHIRPWPERGVAQGVNGSMVCVMRFGWLCRVCASLKDKDRLLLRPGEGRAWTEEEEKESKPPPSLLPVLRSVNNTVPSIYNWQEPPPIGEWTVCHRCEIYRPPRSHHCRYIEKPFPLPHNFTFFRKNISFLTIIASLKSCSYQSMFAGSVVDV